MAVQLDLRADASGVNVAVRVKIRASRTQLRGLRDGELEVALAAPPVDGAANAELLRFLAKTTGIPQSRVTLVSGERARHKRVHFAAIEEQTLLEALLAALPTP
jgi:uncharacterized protein (TIGR00251 family)